MSLATLLGEIDRGWYASPDRAEDASVSIDGALLRRASGSPLGQRLLARWLLADAPASHLFAPRPDGQIGKIAERWPRAKLAALMHDLGILAFAPAIRAEVRREPVRVLKHTLGNGYLLALDKQVWDGKVDAAVASHLKTLLSAAVADPEAAEAALHTLFKQQGRDELCAWAAKRDPALGEWIVLQSPRQTAGTAYLPEKQALFLYSHHEARLDAH